MEEQEKSSLFSLGIDYTTQSHLLSIAKWNKFLAIGGLIMSLLGIGGVIMGAVFITGRQANLDTAYRTGESIGIVLFYSIFFALYIIPCFFRLSFANKMIRALANNDQYLLNQSFGHLKTYSKYWGILTIIMLGLAVIGFALAVIGLAAYRYPVSN